MSCVARLLGDGCYNITLQFALSRTRLHASQRSNELFAALVMTVGHRLQRFHSEDVIFLLLLVCGVLVHDIDLFIGTLLVDLYDVVLALFHQNISNVCHVASLTSLLYLVSDLRVLSEQVV